MRYYKIPQSTFEGLITEAGLLLSNFDIEAAASDSENPGFTDADIICATTGGVNISMVPTYSDYGEDVDNCPVNMMELKHLDGWEAKISTTALTFKRTDIKDAIGAADLGDDGRSVIPRMQVKTSDFHTVWWVSDKANGGIVAAKLSNGLSTAGLSLQTGKNTKGQNTLEYTGHVSINDQSTAPMTLYSINPPEPVKYYVDQNLINVTSSYTEETIEAGASLEAVLTPDSGYSITNVTVTVDGVDVTGTAWDPTTSKVTVTMATGNIVITAVAG